MISKFSREVTSQIENYVYRLIDPRNGQTFYVGRGKGNRVFSHANANLESKEFSKDEDNLSLKMNTIHEILNSGLKVDHIIHRHGLTKTAAIEVEAALIDAFPGLTNINAGFYSHERGVMHAQQIQSKFTAEVASFKHSGVAININRTVDNMSNYEAVRYSWRLDIKRVKKVELVFAVKNGIIIDVFVPTYWLPATPSNFPATSEANDGRIGFIGEQAPGDIKNFYLHKILPKKFRKKGAANPVRYVKPGD